MEHRSLPQKGGGVEAAVVRVERASALVGTGVEEEAAAAGVMRVPVGAGRAGGLVARCVRELAPAAIGHVGEPVAVGARDCRLWWGPSLVAGEAEAGMWGEAVVAAPTPCTSLDIRAFFTSIPGCGTPHSHPPRLSLLSQQQGPAQVCSPNLMFQHQRPSQPTSVHTSEHMSDWDVQGRGTPLCVGLTLSCLPWTGCCTLHCLPLMVPFCPD